MTRTVEGLRPLGPDLATARAAATDPRLPWQAAPIGPTVRRILDGELVGAVPTLLLRTDGAALLYPGEVHSVAGVPESAKGWLALEASRQVLESGGVVVYLDAEDSAANIAGRLAALGVTPDAADRFWYARLEEALDPRGRELGGVVRALLAVRPQFVVIDGVSEVYALLGLDLHSNTDAAVSLTRFIRPLTETGAAVLLIDHVPKAEDGRGRYPLGAQHKLAGVAAAFGTEVVRAPSRSTEGLVKLKVRKDRHGHIRAASRAGMVALLRVTPSHGGAVVTVSLRPADDRDAVGAFRPTLVMRRVSDYLAANGAASKRTIRTAVGGRGETVDSAIDLLVDEGYVERRKEGNASRHYSIMPYEEQLELDAPPVSSS